MYICAVFGDDDFSENIESELRKTIIELIKRDEIEYFLVGQNGAFNCLIRKILWELESYYYDFHYEVVLSHLYLDEKSSLEIVDNDPYATIPPNLPFDFQPDSIDKRDAYMIDEADIVFVYTSGKGGTAEKPLKLAQRKKKKIIHLKE